MPDRLPAVTWLPTLMHAGYIRLRFISGDAMQKEDHTFKCW